MAVPWTVLTKEQKAGVTLLGVFAFFTLGLGALQIRNTMYRPFALSSRVPVTLRDQINNPELLRFRDTDHDGLSDFDEQYVYGTSLYLADTDSDGSLDSAEISAGTDPLCPAGRSCFGAEAPPGYGAAPVTTTTPYLAPPPPFNEAELLKEITDPASLRTQLRASGVSEEVLKRISDAELQAAVNQLFNTSTLRDALEQLQGKSKN